MTRQKLYSVLLLDDEPEILKSLSRVLRSHYEVSSFNHGQDALDALSKQHFPIIISDMRMPEMDGATFLHKAHQINPACQKILLTGHSNPLDTTKAINMGHINFYLTKPWDNQELLSILKTAVEQYVTESKRHSIYKQIRHKYDVLSKSKIEIIGDYNEQENALHLSEDKNDKYLSRLKQTLNNSIGLLNDCIRLHCLDDSSHGERIASQIMQLGRLLELPDAEIVHASIAAKLYQLGRMQLSQSLLSKNHLELKYDQRVSLLESVITSCDMLSVYPELKPTIEILRHFYNKQCENGNAVETLNSQCPTGAELLLICSYFDLLITGKITGPTISELQAREYFAKNQRNKYDPDIYQTFIEMLENKNVNSNPRTEYAVTPYELQVNMKLARDISIESHKSNYLIQGHTLTTENINSLKLIDKNHDETLIIFVHL